LIAIDEQPDLEDDKQGNEDQN